MTDIKLIAFDLDGTLLNSKKEVPEGFFEYVRNHPEYKYCLSSGRQYYALYKDFKEINDHLLYISDNGSFVFDSNKECIYQNVMDKKDVIEVLNTLGNYDYKKYVVCGLKSAYMFKDVEDQRSFADMYYDHLDFVDDIYKTLEIEDIAKIAYYVDTHNAKEVIKTFPKLPKGITAVTSGDDWIDISKIGISKGDAIKYLQKKLNITKDNCMCFGDYMNDYTMFKECKYAIAMGNACHELKEIAYHVTSSNDENGVMKVLENIKKL